MRRLAALPLLLACALGACGGASATHRSTPVLASVGSVPAAPTPVPPQPALPYRWLVPTVGPAPSVAAENRARGTSSWRLSGPSYLIGGRAHGSIAGYVARQALSPGQSQTVYVEAPGSRTVRIDLYRMGWYGGAGGRLVLASDRLGTREQPRCFHEQRTGLTECDWHPTLTFTPPASLASGVYLVVMRGSSGAAADCIFVLRPARAARVMVQLPTATWEAYNAWGGDSLYPGGSRRVGLTGSDQGVEVSYDRPYESETGAGQFFIREVALVRWLERRGYPVGYTTDASLDADPGQLAGARAVIDAGHSEYWSQRQMLAFLSARERGTDLIFLSSDTLAWRVRYEVAGRRSSQAGEAAHRIVAYKEYVADQPSGESTGLFPGGGASLTGSAYNGCITDRLDVPGPPVYRLYPWRPSPALRPRWLFAHTGITPTSEIPGIVGYEIDQLAPDSPSGTRVLGGLDPTPCRIADEPSAIRGYAAESTLYTARSGAFVFASGTLGWLYGLYPVPEASPDAPIAPDPRVEAVTANLIDRALARG